MSILFPAGTYYVGDLCYVLHDEWNEVCDHYGEDEVTLSNGHRFAIFGTAHGDGEYYDSGKLFVFGVDSGSIGVIAVDAIDVSNTRNHLDFGAVVIFANPFECHHADGVLCFGHIVIDTDETYDEDLT